MQPLPAAAPAGSCGPLSMHTAPSQSPCITYTRARARSRAHTHTHTHTVAPHKNNTTPTCAHTGSDSDDDFPPPRAAAGNRRTGGGPAATIPSTAATTPSATNPILAMLGDDDDADEFLVGLAPPKKDAPTPKTASAGGASPLGRAGSAPGAGRREAAGTIPTPASRGVATKSVDTLMSFLKGDDDILNKPLPVVEEEPVEAGSMK